MEREERVLTNRKGIGRKKLKKIKSMKEKQK